MWPLGHPLHGHPLHRILWRASQARKFKTSQTARWGAEATSRIPRLNSPRLGDAEDAKQSSATPGPPAPTLCAHSRAASRAPGSEPGEGKQLREPVKGLLGRGRGALGGEPDPSDTGWGTSLSCPGRRHQGALRPGQAWRRSPRKARSPSAETPAAQSGPDPRSVGLVGSTDVLFPMDVFQRVQNSKVSLPLRSFIPLKISVWLQKISDTILSKHLKYFLTYVPFSLK